MATAPSRESASGGALCLACGLCCQGVLHDHAPLEPSEEGMRARLELPIYRGKIGYSAFALPCPQHRGGRCSVYPDRPAVCDRYSCKLLDRWRTGEVGLEEALSVVSEVQAVIARIRGRMTPPPAPPRLWSAIAAFSASRVRLLGGEEFLRSDRALLLDIGLLLALCHRHFEAQIDEAVAE